ncbi:MAG TPA: amidase family protein, partial [Burkholderiales bacterium]|nr:amidase family protein [Burkholderiales bacterium]
RSEAMRLPGKLSRADANAAETKGFHLEEATIADVHRAFRTKQLTATRLVNLYLNRIKAYNGTCVEGALDPATGLHLGDITPIANAGQLNAFTTLNLKEDKRIALGFPEKVKRTHTGPDDAKFPDALDRARELDRQFARTGKFVGPLHGIPIAIKDNYDTFDMRTTAAAAADYADDRPPDDATMVAKLRAAGAIFLGKTNMDEYAPASIGRSAFGGQTCNPYDTTRIPGGSSSGSAAAVAANLALCALGTDTSGSVRFPSASTSLVGMVATQGLVSRDGIVPISFTRDRGGPLCRTVRDAAILLETLAGYDPKDAVTAACAALAKPAYSRFATGKSLAGRRLGVLRDLMIEASPADRDNIRVANAAFADMKKAGAVIVDPVDVDKVIADLVPYLEPGLLPKNFPSVFPKSPDPIDHIVAMAFDHDLVPSGARGVNLRMLAAQPRGNEARYAINRYFRERGDAKFKSVQDMLAMPMFSGSLDNLKRAFSDTATTLDTPTQTDHLLRMQTLRRVILQVMAENNLDALVYAYSTLPPHVILPNRLPETVATRTEPRNLKAGTVMSELTLVPGEPVLKTDLDTYRGSGGSWAVNLSPETGFPAIVVPAGFTREVYDRVPDEQDPNGSRLEGPKPVQLPVGLEFLGRPFEEAKLFEIASAYENIKRHRRPPAGFGPVADGA